MAIYNLRDTIQRETENVRGEKTMQAPKHLCVVWYNIDTQGPARVVDNDGPGKPVGPHLLCSPFSLLSCYWEERRVMKSTL